MLIAGRVTDEADAPLPGLVVTAHARRGPRHAEDGVARAVTGADGAFRLTLPHGAHARALAVRDRVGIRVLASRALDDEHDAELPIVIARADATGWAVTLGEGRAARLTRGNALTFLQDGEELFATLARLVDGAERRLALSQLKLTPGFVLTYRDDGSPARRLVDALADAALRGVDVRVLLNENAVLPDTVDEVRDALRARGVDADAVVRGATMTFNVMHEKLVLVDDEDALLASSTYETRFWDTQAHAFADARRAGAQPLHHVSVRVNGPAVHHLAAAFADAWNHAVAGEDAGPMGAPAPPPAAGPHSVQVLRTTPPGFTPGNRDSRGETGILEAYLRALANAERFVYLENQYFTSGVITDALARAMDAKPDLEVILVANEHVDIPGYDEWQETRVHELSEHPNFGAFSLWAKGFDAQARRERVRPVYTHSKLAIVDDAWLTLGNANLDGASLHAALEFARPDKVNVEANLAVMDGVDGEPATGVVRDLRERTWHHHLGLPEPDLRERPRDGWLALWRHHARENADAARHRDLKGVRGRVMPLYVDLPEDVAKDPPLLPG